MKKKKILLSVLIVIILTVVLFFGFKLVKRAIINTGYSDREVNPVNRFAKDVTMLELIVDPHKYHGELVSVSGVGQLEFEGDCIFLSKEDYKYYTNNRIWVDLSDRATPYDEAKKFNGRYVIVEGIYDMYDKGHFGMFCGTIKNVTRYELFESDVYIAPQYKEVLSNLKNAFPFRDEHVLVPENPELSYMYRQCESLYQIKYAFSDIDNNGQEEMLLLSDTLAICDLYTIKDGELIHVFDGGERYSYTVYDNGVIKLKLSGGTVSSTDFFKYSEGRLEFIQRIAYDPYKAISDGIIDSLDESTDDNCLFISDVFNAEDSYEGYRHVTSEYAKECIASHTQDAHNIIEFLNLHSLSRYD